MKISWKKSHKLITSLVSALLIVSMLFVTGCKKDEAAGTDEISVPEGHVAVNLANYKIIRSQNISNESLEKVNELKSAIESQSGVSMVISDDWIPKGETADDEQYEILIGATNRPQSSQSLSKINEFGYVIEKNGNKIVINGMTDIVVQLAIDYILTNLSIQGQNWVIPESYVKDSLEYLTLGTNKKADFALIVPASKQTYYARLISKFVSGVSRIMGEQVPVYAKASENTDKTYSVLLAFKNDKGGDTAIDSCDATNYSVYSSGNKVYINGNNYTALSHGIGAFIDILNASIVENNAEKTVKLYREYALKESSVETDFTIPEYKDGSVESIVENNPGYFYYIEKTSEEAFDAYIDTVKASGFELYSENAANGNKFATFVNDSIMLHVYYTAYSKTVRIITEAKGAMLPTTPEEPTENYTDESLTQVVLAFTDNTSTNMGGMSYIITLKDSTFIIVDGGMNNDGNIANTDKLYSELQRLNKRPDGKIIINAWYITHPHADHYRTYVYFASKYGSKVTLDKVICNMPSSYYNGMSTTGSPFESTSETWNCDGTDVKQAASGFGSDVEICTPHTGQIFYIKNIKFEVLYTYEDIYPNPFDETFNDTGCVTRMTIGGKTVMWAADIYTVETFINHTPRIKVAGCDIMVKMWDTYLKSDIVQMPHHGYATSGGPTWYKKVGATIGLWSQGKHWVDVNTNQSNAVKKWFSDGGGKTIYYENEECTITF